VFHKIRGVGLLGEKPLASREEFCPLDLVSFRLSGDDVELDIDLTSCDSVLITYTQFSFDFN
jgi:hypothetical protein